MQDSHVSLGLCSVLAITLDDLSFQRKPVRRSHGVVDYMLANLIAGGMTLRVGGNRLQESILRAWLSGYIYGILLNTTSDNQSTHCIDARCSDPRLLVADRNRSLAQAFSPLACGSCADVGSPFEPTIGVGGRE